MEDGKIDWQKIKFRASSLGNLMTNPQGKSQKELSGLSKTCKKELMKIYIREKFGRKKDIVTKHMEKGILAEPESIKLLCRVDKLTYIKNHEQLENEWFSGHPDIFLGKSVQTADEIWDIKSSWDLETFIPYTSGTNDDYNYQLQVYFDLTGAVMGGIAYCLVSAPSKIMYDEERRMLFAMDVVSEESPEYKNAIEVLRHNMNFEDIPEAYRVIHHKTYRDDELLNEMRARVPQWRVWLEDFDTKFTTHTNVALVDAVTQRFVGGHWIVKQ
jgi:hypothetical protein